MIYKYKKVSSSIIRPIIPIELSTNKNKIRHEVLVDSGADNCIFDFEIAELLGLDLLKGKKGKVIGVSGKVEQTYMHNIALNIGGYNLSVNAYFKKKIPFYYGIVEQVGLFNYFKVIFDYRRERIELRPKPEIN